MSANLDLVRSIFAPLERGDYGSVEWAHREIEYVFADGPSPGSWTGLAGMAEGWRDFLSAWEEYRGVVEEYSASGRGNASGLQLAEMQSKTANVVHVRDGKVMRIVFYFDRQRALADLGLKE